jgi:hypothetical protein
MNDEIYLPLMQRLTTRQKKELHIGMLRMRRKFKRKMRRRKFCDKLFGGHWEFITTNKEKNNE